jgi:hypothetical protein
MLSVEEVRYVHARHVRVAHSLKSYKDLNIPLHLILYFTFPFTGRPLQRISQFLPVAAPTI